VKRKSQRQQNAVRAKRSRKRVKKAPRERRAPAVTASDFLDSLIIASAQALDLTIDPAWHGGVRFNLGLILRLGAAVDDFPLPDDTEPGPVFHA